MRVKITALTVAVVLCAATAVLAVTRDENVLVETVTVDAQSVNKTILCDGVTEAGEAEPFLLQTGCVVRSVEAKEGMYIERDDVIVTIDKESSKVSGQLSQKELLSLSSMDENVRAPQSGILLKVNATEGAWLPKDEAVAVIAPLDKICVRIAIREKHLPLLRVGQAVRISGDGLCVDGYRGTLTEISSTAKRSDKGGTYVEGVVELDDVRDNNLRIGINVACEVIVETVTDCVVIPYEAVTRNGENDRHLYVLSNGRAEKHTIVGESELAEGVLVRDSELVGKSIILQPDAVTESPNRIYVSAEG